MSNNREAYILITTLFFTDSRTKDTRKLVPTPAEYETCSAPSQPERQKEFAEKQLSKMLNVHAEWLYQCQQYGTHLEDLPQVCNHTQQILRVTPSCAQEWWG